MSQNKEERGGRGEGGREKYVEMGKSGVGKRKREGRGEKERMGQGENNKIQ